jgi:hypothetical protein
MKIDIINLFNEFLKNYDAETKDLLWEEQCLKFKNFWNNKVLSNSKEDINDAETDEIIRILDKNAKGSTRESEAVAKAMIAQGAWRRMFNELKNKPILSQKLDQIFKSSGTEKEKLIDELYKLNEENRNNLTGPSGNAINAMIFAYDPLRHISIISLNDRKKVLEYFRSKNTIDFDKNSIGEKIVRSNDDILNTFRELGVSSSPRTISTFLYSINVRGLWRLESENDPVTWGGEKTEPAIIERESTDQTLFYMEKELENFLIKNWEKTDLGKKYDLYEEDGEMVGQQYNTKEVGLIDILAKDKKTGQLVVFELKRNQTSDETVGQLTRYMGWLEENKTKGKPTKGIIITGQYDKKLYYALKKISGCEIYIYQVDFRLKEFKE